MDSDETTRLLMAAGAPRKLADAIAERHEAGDVVPLLRFVLLRSLWREVVDEAHEDGQPSWVARWSELEETGFPFIDVPALRRLRDAGADLDDLTDVVRSAQVLLFYNVANMLDDGARTAADLLGDPTALGVGWQLVARGVAGEGPPEVIGGLHDSLEELDPTGRHGAPRTIEERTLAGMDSTVRQQLVAAVLAGRMAHAALLWRKETGDDQSRCLAAVERLGEVFRRRNIGGMS